RLASTPVHDQRTLVINRWPWWMGDLTAVAASDMPLTSYTVPVLHLGDTRRVGDNSHTIYGTLHVGRHAKRDLEPDHRAQDHFRRQGHGVAGLSCQGRHCAGAFS